MCFIFSKFLDNNETKMKGETNISEKQFNFSQESAVTQHCVGSGRILKTFFDQKFARNELWAKSSWAYPTRKSKIQLWVTFWPIPCRKSLVGHLQLHLIYYGKKIIKRWYQQKQRTKEKTEVSGWKTSALQFFVPFLYRQEPVFFNL